MLPTRRAGEALRRDFFRDSLEEARRALSDSIRARESPNLFALFVVESIVSDVIRLWIFDEQATPSAIVEELGRRLRSPLLAVLDAVDGGNAELTERVNQAVTAYYACLDDVPIPGQT